MENSLSVIVKVMLVFLSFVSLGISGSFSQFNVYVKTQNGETVKEVITANVSDNFVTFEFLQNGGMYVSQLIDFQQELQIFKIYLLGEEELVQPPYQILCFMIPAPTGDLITVDAMSKLRQKNPGTLRSPEEELAMEEVIADGAIHVPEATVLSHHVPTFCGAPATNTYGPYGELRQWIGRRDRNEDVNLIGETVTLQSHRGTPQCKDVALDADATTNACLCHLKVYMPWFPCGLKYCKGRDTSGKTVSYRCGIRTCRKCTAFTFIASNVRRCLRN